MSSYLVSDGRKFTVSLLVAASGHASYIGLGTGSGNTSDSDQALFTELTRISGVTSQATTTTSGDTYSVVGTFTAATSSTITNVRLFTTSGAPVQSQLVAQISSNSQTSIQVNGYGSWPTSYPFNVQVSTEVMTVTSGNSGTSTFTVSRGANGSTALTTAAIGTYVTQVTGSLFAKTNFGGIPVSAGDVLQFTVGVQYQ